MKNKTILILVLTLLAALVLAACSPAANPTDSPSPVEEPSTGDTGYPSPVAQPPLDTGYPAPVEPAPGAVVAYPLPQIPGGENMQRGEVFIEGQEVVMLESFPVQVRVLLSGNLPTPCHQLVYEVAQPDAQNRIYVDVFSFADPAAMCIQVLQPFDVAIDLGSFPSGQYEVFINGQKAGDIQL